MLARNLSGWWLLPLPLWLLAARGAWRRRRAGSVLLLTAVGLLPVATALAFFVQPRYLVVTTAAACVLAGAELADLAPRWRRPAAATAAGLLLAGSLAAFAGPGGWWHPVDHTDQRRAGEWLAAHAGPGDRVMARSFVVEYYAERPTVAMPYDDVAGIVAFARHWGARWLVVDQTSAGRLRPQVLPLLTAGEAGQRPVPPGLRPVHAITDEGRTTRVFALEPAAPPSREPAPSLGFMGDGAG
jgi:hypothetical protein